MKIIVIENDKELGQISADIIKEKIEKMVTAVLGLATGSTPIGMYRELIRFHKNEGLDFSIVVTFNLVE